MEIEHKKRLLAVADAQKHLIWAVLAQLMLIPASFVLPSIGVSLMVLVIFGYSLWAMYRLGVAMGSRVAWLVTLATAIPYIGFIMLLVMNSRATKFLQASGIPVAFLGAKQSDVERLRQDITVVTMPLPPQMQQ